MDVGVALPNNVSGVGREHVLGWARGAEEAGFASVAVLDRLVYDSYEPLVSLAAAAAVTSRVGLLTNVIVLPWRVNAALTAKQLATIQHLSEGRLTVGLGVGARDDDFRVAGAAKASRGEIFESMLRDMLAVWRGEDEERAKVGPRSEHGPPPLLIGGTSPAAFRRVAAYADGWTMRVGTLEQFTAGSAALQAAWESAGRPGRPRRVALSYFAFGADAAAAADGYLRDYYSFLGPVAEVIAGLTVSTSDEAKRLLGSYAEAGADELLFLPTTPGGDQLEALAGAVL